MKLQPPAPATGAPAASADAPAPTLESLTDWLIARIAVYLRRDPREIDPTEPLASYGLDSVAALSLCGDVEEDFDLVLDPTAAWDYPTAATFAEHVLDRLGAVAGRH
jgi:acyl carrier protein